MWLRLWTTGSGGGRPAGGWTPPTPWPPPSGRVCCPGCARPTLTAGSSARSSTGDYAAYVQASGLDSVTQYELWKGIWSSLIDGNLFELAWALRRHNQWLEHFTPMTFVGNHDVTRLATRLRDRRLIGAALAVLLTVGGTPSIYYGDEQAFEGAKEERAGGDDAIRPAFPLGEAGLAPYGWDVFRLHQDLIGLRRRHPWLHRARTEIVDLANRRLTYDSIEPAGSASLRVHLDLDTDPAWKITT